MARLSHISLCCDKTSFKMHWTDDDGVTHRTKFSFDESGGLVREDGLYVPDEAFRPGMAAYHRGDFQPYRYDPEIAMAEELADARWNDSLMQAAALEMLNLNGPDLSSADRTLLEAAISA